MRAAATVAALTGRLVDCIAASILWLPFTSCIFSIICVFQHKNVPCTGLLREHHDEVGRFFAAIQPEGAAAAAQLSGLSLQAELSLAIQRRQYKQCGPASLQCAVKHGQAGPPSWSCDLRPHQLQAICLPSRGRDAVVVMQPPQPCARLCRALQCLEALAAGHNERAALSALPDLPERPQEPAADSRLAELIGMQVWQAAQSHCVAHHVLRICGCTAPHNLQIFWVADWPVMSLAAWAARPHCSRAAGCPAAHSPAWQAAKLCRHAASRYGSVA